MKRQKPTAFTLVELMAALIVISILAGMVVAALGAAAGSARKARAQAQLLAIHQVLVQRMEEYITRRVPNPTTTHQLRGDEASRYRLIQLRHFLRSELPDRKSDLFPPPVNNSQLPPHIQLISIGVDSAGNEFPALDRIAITESPATSRYRNILLNLGVTETTWSPTFEGSETLYLILATSQIGGRSALEIIPADQIRDTDADGVPEILDPWGTPIVWIRWPVGYWLTYADRAAWLSTNEVDRRLHIHASIQREGRDQYDILDSDWRNRDDDTTLNTNQGPKPYTNDTFNIQPLVVSAGPDGLFDMMLRSTGSSEWEYGDPIAYYNMYWKSFGSPHQPLPTTYGPLPVIDTPYARDYYFIDPYCAFDHLVDYATEPNPFLRNLSAGLPGAYYDANGNDNDESTDNIYSVSAQ